jgi:hypothetical protein
MKNLLKSLSDFRVKCPPLVLNKKVSFKNVSYQYTDIDETLKTITPILDELGLVFIQTTTGDTLRTSIFHIESQESIVSEINCPFMQDVKAYAAQETFLKRRQLKLVLGLQGEIDDERLIPEKTKEPISENKPVAPEKTVLSAIKLINLGEKTINDVENSKHYYFTSDQIERIKQETNATKKEN